MKLLASSEWWGYDSVMKNKTIKLALGVAIIITVNIELSNYSVSNNNARG